MNIIVYSLLGAAVCRKNDHKHKEDHLATLERENEKFDEKIDGVSDPCTEAALFWGDQALSEEDVLRIFGRTTDEVNRDLKQAQSFKSDKNAEVEGKEKLKNEIIERDRRKRRAVTALPERRWNNAVIPYEISDTFTAAQRSIFNQAMRHWELHTCVTFIERTDQESYIVFTKRPCGCCSFVGKRGGGPQAVSLGKNCDKFGIVVHELGHVVGFWHEHTRPDRDGYIDVIYANILDNQDYNFQKMPREEINSLGEEYDFGSIMHYSRNTFSRGPFLDTILPKPDKTTKVRPQIGQRTRLSEGDIVQAKKLYSCPTCGQTLQTTTGNASSPGYPGPVPNRQYHCVWRISATPGEKIAINITHLGFTYPDEECNWDFMEIRDGPHHGSELLGRYCATHQGPRQLISSTHRVYVLFRSLSRRVHTGFHLDYEAMCGGEIILKSGQEYEIMSPNFPEEYPSNSNCSWLVRAPPGYQVAFHFDQFEVERHDSCQYDFLQVYDGDSAKSWSMARYCGYEPPKPIKSTTETLFIHFQSDTSVSKPGFMARLLPARDECLVDNGGCQQICVYKLHSHYCKCEPGYELKLDDKSCEATCGGTLVRPSGNITTPGFPQSYPTEKTCEWMIVAPIEYKITLTFHDFSIEGNGKCQYDYIEIRSGLEEDDELLGRHCGSVKPGVLTSKKNELRIYFRSDESVTKKGFSASYAFDRDECAVRNGGCMHQCLNTPGSFLCKCNDGFVLHENKKDCKEERRCSGILKAQEQPKELKSPGYDLGHYNSRLNCEWYLTSQPGHRVRVRWQSFVLEHHPDCGYDRVEAWEQNTMRNKLCGADTPRDYVSKAYRMTLKFFSDTSVNKRGFKLTYQSECGGNLTALRKSQTIYSHPSFGDITYPAGKDCTWVITGSRSKHQNIVLTFESFELEEETDCSYDYLEIRSYTVAAYKECKQVDNNTEKQVHLVLPVSLKFHADDTISKKGFKLRYQIVPQRDPVIE